MIFDLKEVTNVHKKSHLTPTNDSFNNNTEMWDLPKIRKKLVVVGSSGKGGTGKTSIAINIAYSFKEMGYTVAIVDFDTPYGDVAPMLGLKDDKNLLNWLKVSDFALPKAADQLLVGAREGLMVLPSIKRVNDEIKVNSQSLAKKVLRGLEQFEVVVVDAAPFFNELTLEAYRQATDIIFVSEPNVVSLNNIYRGVNFLKENKIDIYNATLMVNKVLKSKKEDEVRYRRITTLNNIMEVPFDYKMQYWVNQNIIPALDKQRSKFSQALFDWCEYALPLQKRQEKKKRFGWF